MLSFECLYGCMPGLILVRNGVFGVYLVFENILKNKKEEDQFHYLTMAVVKPETPAPTMTVSRTAFSSTAPLTATPGAEGAAVAATMRWLFKRRDWPHAMSFVPANTALELPNRAAFPLVTDWTLCLQAPLAWVAQGRDL